MINFDIFIYAHDPAKVFPAPTSVSASFGKTSRTPEFIGFAGQLQWALAGLGSKDSKFKEKNWVGTGQKTGKKKRQR